MSWSHQNVTTCMLANGAPRFPLRMILYTCLPHSLIQPEARGGLFNHLSLNSLY